MKKTLFVLLLSAGVFACGGPVETEKKPISTNTENKNSQIGGEAPAPATPTTPAPATATPATPEAPATAAPAAGKDGLALIEASDCRTCHKNDAKLIGPAYKDVAAKYPNNEKNVKMLAEKIIKGGQGNWGEIPMAGHPNISQEDAEAMVKYVLSVK